MHRKTYPRQCELGNEWTWNEPSFLRSPARSEIQTTIKLKMPNKYRRLGIPELQNCLPIPFCWAKALPLPSSGPNSTFSLLVTSGWVHTLNPGCEVGCYQEMLQGSLWWFISSSLRDVFSGFQPLHSFNIKTADLGLCEQQNEIRKHELHWAAEYHNLFDKWQLQYVAITFEQF